MRVIKRSGNMLFNILVLGTFFYLLYNPGLASASITESIYICVRQIVPALFIYMILARLLVGMPLTSFVFSKFGKYGTELEVLILGLLCGFPVGAKSAVYLYETGVIGKKRAEFICAFTNGASVSFLLGYVGASIFSDINVGVRLVIFQLIASIITAIILRIVYMSSSDFFAEKGRMIKKPTKTGLNEAVVDSTYTMISVCAFIITFFVFAELVLAVTKAGGISGVLIRGFIEFSSGCVFAGSLEPKTAFITISLFIGFSGLCVIMQIMSVIRGKLSSKMYLSGCFISTAVFGILSLLFSIS